MSYPSACFYLCTQALPSLLCCGQTLLVVSSAVSSRQLENVTLLVLPSLPDHFHSHDAVSPPRKCPLLTVHDFLATPHVSVCLSTQLLESAVCTCCLQSLPLSGARPGQAIVHILPLKLCLSKMNLCVPRPLYPAQTQVPDKDASVAVRAWCECMCVFACSGCSSPKP